MSAFLFLLTRILLSFIDAHVKEKNNNKRKSFKHFEIQEDYIVECYLAIDENAIFSFEQ